MQNHILKYELTFSPTSACRIRIAPWGNEDTQQLIDILDRYQVKATFFVVGEWVDKYPDSVQALHEAGHEVMNHSNTHAHYPQLSAEEVICDLNACNDKIEAITGVRPTLVRLPYGDYDDCSINAARSIGMEPIQWDVDVFQTASSIFHLWSFRLISTPSYLQFQEFFSLKQCQAVSPDSSG